MGACKSKEQRQQDEMAKMVAAMMGP